MKALRLMTMVAAVGSAALVMGCKEKNAGTDGGTTDGGTTTTPTTNGGGSTAAAGSPQETLDLFIEALQLRDMDVAMELCDESLGKQQLGQLKASLDAIQAKADAGDAQAAQALNLVQGTLLGPWDNATGEVTHTEGEFAQATITRGSGADSVPLTLNKVNNNWLIVAPAELFGGGAPALPGTQKAPVPLPKTTPNG